MARLIRVFGGPAGGEVLGDQKDEGQIVKQLSPERNQPPQQEASSSWRGNMSESLGALTLYAREWLAKRKEHILRDTVTVIALSSVAFAGYQNSDEISSSFYNHFNAVPKLERVAGSDSIEITPGMLFESGYDNSISGIVAFMATQEDASGWNISNLDASGGYILQIIAKDPDITTRTVYTDQSTGQTFSTNPIYNEGLQVNKEDITSQTVVDFSSQAEEGDQPAIKLPLIIQPVEE